MLALRERRRWAVALGLLSLCGAVGAFITYVKPELVAQMYLPPGTDPALARTFILPDLAAYVVFPALAAYGNWSAAEWTGRVLWIAAGAALYAFLWIAGTGAVAGMSFVAALSGLVPFFVLLFAATRWRSAGADRSGPTP